MSRFYRRCRGCVTRNRIVDIAPRLQPGMRILGQTVPRVTGAEYRRMLLRDAARQARASMQLHDAQMEHLEFATA